MTPELARRMPSIKLNMTDAKTRLIIRASREEVDWVKHAAKLRGLSMAEYVKRAINNSLMREGVDAVLFQETERQDSISPDHEVAVLRLQVKDLRTALGTLISWMAQSANSPICVDEAEKLLSIINRH